ncbi:chemotaxis protein CheC [Ruminococcaceae bacterium OttesenSCG-928-L11]|nr:chemotaxis protein CheC [Ruminococcaceae bacterium OttesenSCG-928-L11]
MNQSYESLNPMHMDVLREIGNIGAGNAATSLSMMLGMPVDMTLPKVNLVDFNDVAEAVGGPENMIYGVLLGLEGDVDGMIMFLLDKNFAHMVVNILMGGTYENFEAMDEMALSAIKEVGNILSGAYANSIAELTGLFINLTTPSVSIDMAGALLSVPIIKFGAVGDKVLFIEENFKSDAESVMSHMILFAEVESLNLILGKLGLL